MIGFSLSKGILWVKACKTNPVPQEEQENTENEKEEEI